MHVRLSAGVSVDLYRGGAPAHESKAMPSGDVRLVKTHASTKEPRTEKVVGEKKEEVNCCSPDTTRSERCLTRHDAQ
eukprot:2607347-Amphidinium_carterae.1